MNSGNLPKRKQLRDLFYGYKIPEEFEENVSNIEIKSKLLEQTEKEK